MSLQIDFPASRIHYLLHLANAKHNGKLLNSCQENDVSREAANNNKKPSIFNDCVSSDAAPKNPQPHYRLDQFLPPNMHSDANGKISLRNTDIGVDAVKENKEMWTSSQSNTQSNVIPNVFDDGIYEFIESIGKSNIDLPNVPKANETSSKVTELSKLNNSKYGFNKDSSTPKVSPESARQSSLLSWRERPNERWRVERNDCDSISRSAKIVQSVEETVPVSESKRQTMASNVTPNLITQHIIQNGAILTGVGVKPCPTYELNNLYNKFPHLNPNKVPNPLKPVPLKDIKRPVHETKKNENPSKQSDGSQQLANNNFSGFGEFPSYVNLNKSSELTNSLQSLPTFPKTNTVSDQSKNRMPQRSASSVNLTKHNSANPPKNHRPNANKQQSNNQNKRPQTKGKIERQMFDFFSVCSKNNIFPNSGNQNGGGWSSSTLNDQNKGAISKQPTRNTAQIDSRKSSFDVATKTVQNAHTNDQKSVDTSKTSEKNKDSKETLVVNNVQLLSKLIDKRSLQLILRMYHRV